MKLAIISDTHFGDNSGSLIVKDLKSGMMTEGPKYEAFEKAVGKKNDYLILAGDIFDFSIASYETAYDYGKKFFSLIKENNVADEIIYIPGNHDADIWHIVQHQRNVINRISNGKPPKKYEHSVAGIIDDRENSNYRGFWLNNVRARREAGRPKYGEMFLDFIIEKDKPIAFNFAYPNLYLVTDTESVLVTHGQYLETYWSFFGELLLKIAYSDLNVGHVDIEEIVEMNFPLNQLACTGIGQAGVFTKLARKIQTDVKGNNLSNIKRYLSNLEKTLDQMTEYGWAKELVTDYLLKAAKKEILETIKGLETTRYRDEFICKKAVSERFCNYYKASLMELGAIRTNSTGDQCFDIPAPWRVIFGHTHQPISWNEKDPPKWNISTTDSSKRLSLHNTGGWLRDNGRFCGAEVFTYETGKGFSSIRIN